MQKRQYTPIALGNASMRAGKYAEAVRHYAEVLINTPALSKNISANFTLAKRKYRYSRQGFEEKRVGICSSEPTPDISGRAYVLLGLYETFSAVESITSLFPESVCETIQEVRIAKNSSLAEGWPCYIKQAISFVAAHPYDIVHLFGACAPNVRLGFLYKILWDAKVVIDIGDEEPAFVGGDSAISIDSYLNEHDKQLFALANLGVTDLARPAIDLLDAFDGITVSNNALQKRYGGIVIHDARDEKAFEPTSCIRKRTREEYGISQEKKIVLSFVTPRGTDGLIETAKAIGDLRRDDVLFAIVGDFQDKFAKSLLQQIQCCEILFIDHPPCADIQHILAIADCCVFLRLSEDGYIYRQPPRLIDAAAMGVPILASSSPALKEFFGRGIIIEVQTQNLCKELGGIVLSPIQKSRSDIIRSAFFDIFGLKVCAQKLAGFLSEINGHRAGQMHQSFVQPVTSVPPKDIQPDRLYDRNQDACGLEEDRDYSALIRSYHKQKPNRRARIAVFTAVTGGYDELINPEYIVNEWDYILYTDGDVKSETVYEMRKIPFEDEDPVRIARYVKLNAHLLISGYEYVLWVDGNILLRKGICQEVQRHIDRGERIVFRKHPSRVSIYEEISKCQELKKDDFGLMNYQLEKYKNVPYVQRSELFETNVILRRLNDVNVKRFNELWWNELRNGSRRDQLSVNYALDMVGLRYSLFDENVDIRDPGNSLYFLFQHKGAKAAEKRLLPKVRVSQIHLKANTESLAFVYSCSDLSEIAVPYKYKAYLLKGRDLGFLERAVNELRRVLKKESDRSGLLYGNLVLIQLLLLRASPNNEEIIGLINDSMLMAKSRNEILCFEFLRAEVDFSSVGEKKLADDYSEDRVLQWANFKGGREAGVASLNKVLRSYGLQAVRFNPAESKCSFDCVYPARPLQRSGYIKSQFKVTVIVSCFNVEKVVKTSLSSLLSQTWANLEIICVDDNSSDGTVAVIEQIKALDSRVVLYRNERNRGTYANRNFAAQKALGDFVTVADADDWHHPEKIQYQAQHLINSPNIVANVASWLRATNDLVFSRRNGLRYKQLNISSLMFRREVVLKSLGGWDEVRFAADGEFYKRLKLVFVNAVSELPAITSLGRYEGGSLTNDNVFGYFGFPFGARKEYLESYECFHKYAAPQHLTYRPGVRSYPAPGAMLANDFAECAQFFDEVFLSDLRIEKYAHLAIDFIYKCQSEAKTWGVCHVPKYEWDPRKRIDESLRKILNKLGRNCLTFGEKVETNELHLIDLSVPVFDYAFLPAINARDLIAVQVGPNSSVDKSKFRNEAGRKFGDGVNVIFSGHAMSCSDYSLAEEHGYLPSLYMVDISDLSEFAYRGSNKICIIMPCIDVELGKKTAEILIRRSGVDCTVIIAFDSIRQGFIRTLNSVARKVNSRYICYVAQDAYPGRDWLKVAYEAIFREDKGLLSFNDGKWHGRIASFGMVKKDWVYGFYGDHILYEAYRSHKADNEITLLARLDNNYVYCPDSVLMEIDYNKDSGGSNQIDDEVFRARFNSGFGGLFGQADTEKYRKEYKVKNG